jgi:hypothetical protein
LEAALESMIHLDDATGMAEFVLAIASRVAQARQQSLSDIGRAGDWERAHRLLDFMAGEERVLWALLLAAEHLEHVRHSQATTLMHSLLKIKLPHLTSWEAPFAAECLADLSEVDRQAFHDLADRLFGEYNPDSFWRSLVARGHIDSALERARRRGTWLEVHNILKYEIERQIKVDDYAAAWRILFSVTGLERPPCEADIAYAQSSAGYTTSALEQLALVAPAQRFYAFIKLAQLGQKLGAGLGTRAMLEAARAAAAQIDDDGRFQALVDLTIAEGLHGDNSASRAKLMHLVNSQPALADDWRVYVLIGLTKLGDVADIMDLLRKYYQSSRLPFSIGLTNLIVELCRLSRPEDVLGILEYTQEETRIPVLYHIAQTQIALGHLEAALEAMNGISAPHLAAEYVKQLFERGRVDEVDSYLRAQIMEEYRNAVLSSVASLKSATGDVVGALATLDQITTHAWKVTAILQMVTDLAARSKFEEALMIAAKNQSDYGYENGRYPHLTRTIASHQWIAEEHDRCRSTMAAILTRFANRDGKSMSADTVARIASARIDAHDWLQADRIMQLITDDKKRREIRLAHAEARLAAGDFEVVAELVAVT